MIHFVPRSTMPFKKEPQADLPMWLSKLLYMRGIDTKDKAERFLEPKLTDLHDPLLIRGMANAVDLIRSGVLSHAPMVIYGDYDVDGICAAAILYKALSSLGADVSTYLPARHGEGYGLNEDAVRTLAKTRKMLITVDCGITNHAEVALAMALGMTVIVTDHHEPPQTLPPANAVVNPLLGAPFERLCGAGVALKLAIALCGLEAVVLLLPLCALATVADMVPLIDENRVIVHHGLALMADTPLPGLRALMDECALKGAVTSQDLGFRLAPRLNAAGRLSDADKGLKLLLTDDPLLAAQMAKALSEENDLRRKAQDEMIKCALTLMQTQVDFKRDRAIVIVGEDFNPGIIGLCAGRLCEKYHYPTLILSLRGDGLMVGSARSIKGVNIHTALTMCQDLFVRFGGHAQAAGLTMEEGFLPELRRRLNLAINAIADPACYVEQKEYDLPLALCDATEQMVNALIKLEPTGYANPAPVFLARELSAQRVRAVGREGAHLSISFLQGQTLLNGIYFANGHLAGQDMTLCDVLYTPQINHFNGTSSVQMQVHALAASPVLEALPENDTFHRALLKDLSRIIANKCKIPSCENLVIHPLDKVAQSRLLSAVQGTLIIARTRETALLYHGQLGLAKGTLDDPRGFSTLLILPDTQRLTDAYRHILLADGVLCQEEALLIKSLCPGAALYAPDAKTPAMKSAIAAFDFTDAKWRDLYKTLVTMQFAPLPAIQSALALTPVQLEFVLDAFMDLALIESSRDWVRILPPKKCVLADSRPIAGIRSAAAPP